MVDRDKEYLGDSVYCAHDGYHVILTTENGYGASNRIALEPAVMANLELYVESLRRRLAKEREAQLKEQEDGEQDETT